MSQIKDNLDAEETAKLEAMEEEYLYGQSDEFAQSIIEKGELTGQALEEINSQKNEFDLFLETLGYDSHEIDSISEEKYDELLEQFESMTPEQKQELIISSIDPIEEAGFDDLSEEEKREMLGNDYTNYEAPEELYNDDMNDALVDFEPDTIIDLD